MSDDMRASRVVVHVVTIVLFLMAMAPNMAWAEGLAISSLFDVATTAGGEGTLSAAFDGTNFLVGIQGDGSSDHNIVGQRVDSDGHLIGDLISTGRTGGFPYVAFGGGNYLMVWTDDGASPNDDIYGQLIDTSGTLVRSAFSISADDGEQSALGVAFNGSNFLVVWRDDETQGLYGRFVSTSGLLVGSRLTLGGRSHSTAAAVASDGQDCLLVWQRGSLPDGGDPHDTVGRIVHANGNLGAVFTISETSSPAYDPVSIAYNGSHYLVAWNHDTGAGHPNPTLWDVLGRCVSTNGTVLGSVLTLASGDGDQVVFPCGLASDQDGFLLTWTSGTELADANDGDVYARGLDSDGVAQGEAILITSEAIGCGVSYGGEHYLCVLNDNFTTFGEVGGDVRAAFADPNNLWEIEPSMTVARDQFAGGVIGDYLYVFGGNDNLPGGDQKSTEIFNFGSGTWSFGADNEHNGGEGVEELTAAVVDDKLYVFGALDVGFAECYDPSTDTWLSLASKPTAAHAAPAVVYDGEIYIFGGDASDQVVEAYDPMTDTWRSVTTLPNALFSPAVAVVGSKAYVMGGVLQETSSFVCDVISFDFETGQWQTTGYASVPSACVFTYSSAAPVVDGKIYLVGGIGGDPTDESLLYPVDTVYIFDPVANTWEQGPALPEPRCFHLVAAYGGCLYVAGGCTDRDDPNDPITAADSLDGLLSLDVSSPSDVGSHVFEIEMSKTYDYRHDVGAMFRYNFDAAVQADDSVNSIVMTTPEGSDYVLTLEDGDGERWFNHHVSSFDEADLADFTTGTYTFTVSYDTGGSDTTTVVYALSGGEAIPPVTQRPMLSYPSDGSLGVPVSVTFQYEALQDAAWTAGLEWEAITGSDEGDVEGLPCDVNSYGPVALEPNTGYQVTLTIGHAVWGTNPDGIPTVVDTDAEERFTFTTGSSVRMLHDWNGDGIISIVGDVPPFVDCVYFGNCPDGVDTIAVGDCNGDGILSIIGDVPCFVDCVYFSNCDD